MARHQIGVQRRALATPEKREGNPSTVPCTPARAAVPPLGPAQIDLQQTSRPNPSQPTVEPPQRPITVLTATRDPANGDGALLHASMVSEVPLPPPGVVGSTFRRVVALYRMKSLAVIEPSVVAVSRMAKSAASEPPVLTSTSRSAPAMSLMRSWPAAAKAPVVAVGQGRTE